MCIWWGRVGERIRSGRLCLRAAMAMMYDAITHSVMWIVAFSKPLVRNWSRPSCETQSDICRRQELQLRSC